MWFYRPSAAGTFKQTLIASLCLSVPALTSCNELYPQCNAKEACLSYSDWRMLLKKLRMILIWTETSNFSKIKARCVLTYKTLSISSSSRPLSQRRSFDSRKMIDWQLSAHVCRSAAWGVMGELWLAVRLMGGQMHLWGPSERPSPPPGRVKRSVSIWWRLQDSD